MGIYHDGMPEGTPPKDAIEAVGPIYRGIKKLPIDSTSFVSHVEQGISHGGNPEAWGLSIWRNIDAAQHAKQIFRFMRKWHIAEGYPPMDRGVMIATPRNDNPGHWTWWKPIGYDPSPDFSIILISESQS